MAIAAMTVHSTVTYVSDKDPSKVVTQVPLDPADPTKGTVTHTEIREDATTFLIRPLDVFLLGHIYDNASLLTGKSGSEEVGIHTRVNKTNIEAVRHGLIGFENFARKDGTPIRFTTTEVHVNGRDYTVASDDVMSALGIQLVQELAGKIKEISEVSAVEEKNFASA